jgi:hypothetical protein
MMLTGFPICCLNTSGKVTPKILPPTDCILRPASCPVARVELEGEAEDEFDLKPWVPAIPGHFVPPPAVEVVKAALMDIGLLLRPRRTSGIGTKDLGLDALLQGGLEQMQMFLRNYTDHSQGVGGGSWTAAPLRTAKAFGRNHTLARRLREWTHAYIADQDNISANLWDVELLHP